MGVRVSCSLVNLITNHRLNSAAPLMGATYCTPEIVTSDILVEVSGMFKCMFGIRFRCLFSCSMACSDELSLSRRMFTGMLSGPIRWILTCPSSGVPKYPATLPSRRAGRQSIPPEIVMKSESAERGMEPQWERSAWRRRGPVGTGAEVERR